MAMYLACVPVFTIMLLSRWLSDTFLRYIRKQVKEFSSGIRNENFFTITNAALDNPKGPNQPLNHTTRSNIGFNFKGTVTPLASAFC
jgi:hypothetical protein